MHKYNFVDYVIFIKFQISASISNQSNIFII